jgi:hypothetical protein
MRTDFAEPINLGQNGVVGINQSADMSSLRSSF